MKSLSKYTLFALLSLLFLVAGARGSLPEQGSLPGDPVVGGRLYDNWMVELDLKPPVGNQPLWEEQENNTRSGEVTWRCKECHGWDYKGAEGAFDSDARRYTGFPGLEGAIGADQEEVTAWLDGSNNPDHNFLRYSNPTAIEDLAAFLRTQQLDVALIIDYETGLSYGDEQRGANLYDAACAPCHGEQGDSIDFSAGAIPLFVGDVARVDPWRTVHKIRFGTPAGRMPASEDLAWSLAKVADVLAYAQTLRRGNLTYTIFTDEPGSPAIERQGEIEPIIWAAGAIVSVLAVSIAWDRYQQRQTQ